MEIALMLVTSLACVLVISMTRINTLKWYAGPLGTLTAKFASFSRVICWMSMLVALWLAAFSDKALTSIPVALIAGIGVFLTPGRNLPKLREHTLSEEDTALRVYSANILCANSDFGVGIAEEILTEEPDFVVLAEASPEAVAGMNEVFETYPYLETIGEEEYRVIFLSKYPIIEHATLFPDLMRPFLSCKVQVEGKIIEIISVHTASPWTRERTADWAKSLLLLAEYIVDAEPQLVLAGDFNATLAHAPLRKVVAARNLTDSNNFRATWPANRHRLPIFFVSVPSPKMLSLDHVFTTGMLPLSCRLGTGVGSDHAPIIADISLVGITLPKEEDLPPVLDFPETSSLHPPNSTGSRK